jgi:hypothetical protein
LILLFFCLKENVDTHRFLESLSGATPMATPNPGKNDGCPRFLGKNAAKSADNPFLVFRSEEFCFIFSSLILKSAGNRLRIRVLVEA